jgi:hypothetical protein
VVRLALVAALIAAALCASGAGADALPGGSDDRAEGASKLDLVGARLVQTAGGQLALVLRTNGPWMPSDVDPSPTQLLCVFLRSLKSRAPGARLCVVPQPRASSGVGLRFTTLDASGNRVGIRDLPTVVTRRPRMVSAIVEPAQLRLSPGRYGWQARSISAGVEDRLPDGGEVPLRIARASAPPVPPRCFGAASRDPRRLCRNPLLRRTVLPSPRDAPLAQNSPCTPLQRDGVLSPCEFGVPAADARATVALIGDSHAAHWRAALEVVAQKRRWRGISITRSGCPYSRAAIELEKPARLPDCLAWNAQLPRWLARHPEIRTVFISQHIAGRVRVGTARNALAAKMAGLRAAWRALPASVTQIVVIRDTPLVGLQTLDCVRRARAALRDASRLCALPRRLVLAVDPAIVAAHRLRSRRVRAIDMTPFLCNKRRCFTVVGGALVYKDGQHLTDTFATSLGPYLLRAFDEA